MKPRTPFGFCLRAACAEGFGAWALQCRSGAHGAQALPILRRKGHPRFWNLKGGTLAWAGQVDPSTPKC